MNKYILYAIAVVIALAVLFLLLKLSNSRFQTLKLSYKGTPAPYNPYVYDYHPVEGFTDVEDALKDAGPRAKIYTEQNFKGNTKTLEKNVVLDANFASKIKSLMVGPYTKVTIYIGRNYSGESISFDNDHDLWLEIPLFKGQQSKFSNNVKSIKLEIVEPYVIAYTQNNLGGFSKIFHEKHPILGTEWERKIKSLVISPYTKVTLYKRAGLSPDPSDVDPITNSTANEMKINYVGREADGNIRSLKVQKLF
jgi:hypothetical protein